MLHNNLNYSLLASTSKNGAAKMLILFFLFIGLVSMANSRKHHGDSGRVHKREIPDLTSDQKSKIKALRIGLQKDMLTLKNQLGEKRAKLQTLETSEKVDISVINTQIDEIQSLEAKIKKLKAAQRQEIRKLLTIEQRVHFDTQDQKNKKGKISRSFDVLGK